MLAIISVALGVLALFLIWLIYDIKRLYVQRGGDPPKLGLRMPYRGDSGPAADASLRCPLGCSKIEGRFSRQAARGVDCIGSLPNKRGRHSGDLFH